MNDQKTGVSIKARPKLRGMVRLSAALAVFALVMAVEWSGGSAEAQAQINNRCDVSFNTKRFNNKTELVTQLPDHSHIEPVNFTLKEWVKVFGDKQLGLSKEQVLGELEQNDIYRRHILGGILTHTLQPDQWQPMTDPAQCNTLAGQLQAARDVAARYPTAAHALAAGYTLGDWYNAGLGVHFQNYRLATAFDPSRPGQILYDGTGPDANVVGLSYVVFSAGHVAPEGFAGKNDRWHRHLHFCLDAKGVNLSSDVLTAEECAALGGTRFPNPDIWMLHVWVVPGCESDWGMFSSANSRLPYIPAGASFAPGCNSGKAVTRALQLDERGNGPKVD